LRIKVLIQPVNVGNRRFINTLAFYVVDLENFIKSNKLVTFEVLLYLDFSQIIV